MEGAVSHQSPIDPTSDFFHHLSFVLLDQCYSPLTFFSVAAAAKSLQLCPTLCEPIDGSPPGSPVPGILQARTLECLPGAFGLGRAQPQRRGTSP